MTQTQEEDSSFDDFDRIVASLNKHKVDFMIIGGFAVVYHGYVRNTKDLDIFIRRSEDNAGRTVAALEEVGFGSPDMTPEVFTALRISSAALAVRGDSGMTAKVTGQETFIQSSSGTFFL